MDFNALVDEITSRVAAKLEAQNESLAPCVAAKGNKPKLLVLASKHADECRRFTDNAAVAERYDVECAQPGKWSCDAADYDVLVFFDLSLGDMAGIATGICATQFAIAARKALLLGKKLFVAHEGVELYGYAETAPSAYYSKLLEHLVSLQKAGMTVCPLVSLEEAILSGCEKKSCCAAAPEVKAAAADAEAEITKRVVTEKDIAALYTSTLQAVRVAAKAIVTDLAREYASSRHVAIIKDERLQVNKK